MKITNYPSISVVHPDDLLLVVTNVAEDAANKKLTIRDFLSNLNMNLSLTGELSITGDVAITGNSYSVTSEDVTFTNATVDNLIINSNGFILSTKNTPANSSVFESGTEGKFSFDDNYLYIKVSDDETKRVQLVSF